MSPHSRRWTRQPQGAVERRSSLNPSLLWLGSNPLQDIGYADGVLTQTTSSLLRQTTEKGIGVQAAGTGGVRIRLSRRVFLNGDLTVLVFGAPTAATQIQRFLGQSGSVGNLWVAANTDENFTYVSGQLCLGLLQTGVNRSSIKIAGTIDGGLHCWVIRKVAGGHACWRDGERQTVVTSGTLTGAPTAAADVVDAIGSTDASLGLLGPATTMAVVNEGLSDIICQSLSLDPWQLFAPRRIWVPQAAASGLPTLSAATYVPGSLTASGFRPRVTATY